MNWTESPHCSARVHCVACRHDQTFRASLFSKGFVAERDFACPYGVSAENVQKPVLKPAMGVGTELKKIFALLKFLPKDGCQCNMLSSRMDRMGIEWCNKNEEALAVEIVKEANRRDWLKYVPGKQLPALGLIRMAIHNAEKIQSVTEPKTESMKTPPATPHA